MVFEKIAVKPGKPTWFGQLNRCPVLGLPGNPASALVCAHLFLRALMQAPEMTCLQASLTEHLPANGPRETYLRGRMHLSERTGRLLAMPFPKQDSSLLTPFLNANVLIKRESAAPAVPVGESVSVLILGTGPSLSDYLVKV